MAKKHYISMPKKLLGLWLKALRSGMYKQTTKGTLYDPETKGFCCLGVLQHIAMNGQVEGVVDDDGDKCPESFPSKQWLNANGIRFYSRIGTRDIAPYLPLCGQCASFANDDGVSFDRIADAIEATAEGY